MIEQIAFASNKKAQDVTLKSLLDTPLRCIVAKILEVCIKEKESLGPFQYAMKISAQNKIIEIFNKQPGIVEELYVKPDDIITIESVLYTLTYQIQDVQIVQISKANPIKKYPKIRINIITQNQYKESTEKEDPKQEKQTLENHLNIQSSNLNIEFQNENHSQIVTYQQFYEVSKNQEQAQ
ncbi:unnamed protein product [Paramecium octaurelia]|uniref:Uncharacterized protein n=1 Tax=Paramecium octaurelia TaxID=43137 RepID=A0A8S1WSL2_PAROT|nr:unnamed protein product [Paramecium octaurelia]